MSLLKVACTTAAMLALVAGPALAAAKPKPMTKAQTAAWEKCQAMPNDAMMKNKKCASLSKIQTAGAGPGSSGDQRPGPGKQ